MPANDLVSVLIPAFKPGHFRAALESVLAQEHGALEVIVGDDSPGAGIRAIVEELADPRVAYVPSRAVTGGDPKLNHVLLWHKARGRYVRFMYDDDLIAPTSTGALLGLLRAQPGCALSWHQRRLIDEHGRVTQQAGPLKPGQTAVMDRALLLDNMAKFLNFVGEPSFTMFDRERVPHFGFNRYGRWDTAFLWDIAMYLAATEHGLAHGSGDFLGDFRVHSGQVSSRANVFGAVEWELVFREELRAGRVSVEQFHVMLPKLLGLYQASKHTLPALHRFQSQLLADAQAGRLRESTPEFLAHYEPLLAEHR
ncbi:MAG: glycosyltransferase family 2 protein [Burkholderiaceae bacterium]